MERIIYRKTLDVHKNGTQFVLQGFETADNKSRVIEVSLMASGDAIDFPLERLVAVMYVTTPGATEPSIHDCTIKDNKVVYEALPIVVEGITTMQIKLIEASPDGATSVLASPKFAVEVLKSEATDEDVEQTTTFTAFEDAVAKAKAVYDERFIRMELASDCTFRAYYADGTIYETDVLKRLFNNGNVLLSESYAHGGTGVRAGEDTDNSMYYSNVSRSEALNAKDIMENSRDVLDEVRLHGVYTAFSVDFTTGEVEYVSPSSKFVINRETGELDAIGQSYTFNEEIGRVVDEWLVTHDVELSELQNLATRVTPMDKGGTGAYTVEGARENLEVFSKDEICTEETLGIFGLSSESKPIEAMNLIGSGELADRFKRNYFASGSYVGTGVYGSANPTEISVPFQPKIFLIGTEKADEIFLEGCFGPTYTSVSHSSGTSSKARYLKYDNGKVYLYSVSDAIIQKNVEGTTYYWYALK